MPELPEVEAVVRKLRQEAVGARIRAVEIARVRTTYPQQPGEMEKAIGKTIDSVERCGKNIVIRLSGGYAIRVHLRMTGDLYVVPDARLRPATARALFTLGRGRGLVFDDPRVLGTMHFHSDEEIAKKLEAIGVDPLTRQFTPEMLIQRSVQSKLPAKLFLMDQRRIAGIGNIYAAEALFLARIHPARRMNSLRKPQLVALHAAIRAVLRRAVKTSVKGYRQPGYFEEMQFAVYGRKGEPCRRCAQRIERITQAGRSTYFCPRCQKPAPVA
jgi:formamidopyrimidine-DNA glycosylase